MEQTQPLSSQLPWRLREEQFRRYEQILKVAVDLFPLVYIVNIKAHNLPTSLQTCSARLRDAKLSYSRYNWVSTIDRQKYLLCRDELIVAEDQTGKAYLALGRLDEVRNHFKSAVPQHPIISKAQEEEDGYHLLVERGQFYFLCQLASNNVFKRDLIISSDDPLFSLSEHVEQAAADYAISLVPEGDKWRFLNS